MNRSPLLVTLFAAAAAACAAPTSGEEDGEVADQALAATTSVMLEAKLYEVPRAEVNASCDVHTAVTLSKRARTVTMALENCVLGTCEILVVPDKRQYEVIESDSCGSTVYKGTKGADSVSLQNNAMRRGEDRRPAAIAFHETRRRRGDAEALRRAARHAGALTVVGTVSHRYDPHDLHAGRARNQQDGPHE